MSKLPLIYKFYYLLEIKGFINYKVVKYLNKVDIITL